MKRLRRLPSLDEVTRLLAAWRLWLLGALLGGLAAGLVYLVFPPAYRAQATVLVDHNVYHAVPEEEKDQLRFYYLQQETDLLMEIAWSDMVLERVSAETGVSMEALRGRVLRLNQPGMGGWHFEARSSDPQQAAAIAAAWAREFHQTIQAGGAGISPVLETSLVQVESPQVSRALAPGASIFFGSLAGAACLALFLLFFDRKEA